MRIKQLINELQQFDPELPVVINGYEGGKEDVEWQIEEYDGVEWVAEKHRTWR